MKIGFDAKRIFNNTTGLGNYSRSLVRNLQEYYPEHQYYLFSPEAKETRYAQPFFSRDKFRIHESKTRLKSYWRSFSIVKDLKYSGIDLYHGLSNELPYNLQREGIKSIVTIHDLIFKIYPETYSFPERVIYDRKFRSACRQADKIIAISESTKRDIIRFYQIDPSRIEVIYQVCNPLFYTLRSDAENREVIRALGLPEAYFLYVGSVEPRKNLKIIIEAYRMNAGQIRFPLVIVGKGGTYKTYCKKLIEAYKLNHCFIWLEQVKDNTQLQSLYQCAGALVYPSFYEGFGLPVAEALLSKTPVITADTSSLQEAGGPDSIYINPENAAELSAAMISITSDKSSVIQMTENGYAYAQNMFATQTLTAKMMECYQSL